MFSNLKMKMLKKLNRYHWDWILVGTQLISFGSCIWYNALHDNQLHPVFTQASEPLWVYIPFLFGFFAIYVGVKRNVSTVMVKSTIYSLTLYWAIMTALLITNDSFHGHISIISSVTWTIIPKIWLMAWRTDFEEDGVKI